MTSYADTDDQIKFGDSKSNGSRDIRGADFVSNERNVADAYGVRRKRLLGVSLKN